MRRWLTSTLVAGGCNRDLLPLDVAVDAAEALLETGRAVRPSRYAPHLFAPKG